MCAGELCVLPGSDPGCTGDGSEVDYAFAGDGFDDDDIAPELWRMVTNNVTARVVERYGQVHVQPPALSSGHAYLETAGQTDLRGKSIELEVFGAAAGEQAESVFEITAAAGTIGLRVHEGVLEYVGITSAAPTVRSLGVYDPDEHRRWRLSVDPVGETLTIELVAMDGTVSSRTEPLALDVSTAGVRFGVRGEGYHGPGFRVGSFDLVAAGPAPDCALACTSADDCGDGTCRYGFCVSTPAVECLLGTMHELQTSFDSLAGWMEIHQPASPAGRVLVGAQLQIEPYDDAGYSSGIVSKDIFDLRDSHVTIEVAGTTTDSTGVESFVAVGPSTTFETDYLAMGKSGNSGFMRLVRGSVSAQRGSFTLPDGRQFWRIAEHAGVLYVELSENGLDWELVSAEAPVFPVVRVTVGLAAGSIPASEAETDRGIFRVDGLNRGPKQ